VDCGGGTNRDGSEERQHDHQARGLIVNTATIYWMGHRWRPGRHRPRRWGASACSPAEISGQSERETEVVEKDYVLGWLLAGIAGHPQAGRLWVFKGGTCLKKCFFETYRFSEDLDSSLLADAEYSESDLVRILREIADATAAESRIQFGEVVVNARQNRQGQQTFEGRRLSMPRWRRWIARTKCWADSAPRSSQFL